MPPAEVVPGLYLGDKKDAKDRGALRRLNIQAVVNCTPPKNVDPAAGCPSFFVRELRYHRVPIYDSPAEDAAQHFAAVLDFIAGRLHHGGVLGTQELPPRPIHRTADAQHVARRRL